MKFIIPIKTVSEANRRDHWAVKARRANGQRHTARIMMLSNFGPEAKKVYAAVGTGHFLVEKIILTRVGPRTLDSDNLAGALKAVRDGVADALGINDAVDIWHYGQRKGKTYAVEVEVE